MPSSKIDRGMAGALSVLALAAFCSACGSSSSGKAKAAASATPSTTSGPSVTTAPASTSAPATSAPATSAPVTPSGSASGGGGAGSMNLMGAITGTVTQASGGSCSAGSSGNTDGTLPFSGAGGSYTLTFSLPSGMTTYPDDGGKTLVTLSNAADSAKKWSVGHNDQSGRGIINFDGKKGTINVTMAYHGPSGSPELGPVIASGTIACP